QDDAQQGEGGHDEDQRLGHTTNLACVAGTEQVLPAPRQGGSRDVLVQRAPDPSVAWQTFASRLVAAEVDLRGEKILTVPAMVVPGAVSVPDRRCGGVAEPG